MRLCWNKTKALQLPIPRRISSASPRRRCSPAACLPSRVRTPRSRLAGTTKWDDLATRWTMPKPVRFNTLFFLLSLSLSSFCLCLGNKNGPLGVEIKEKKFSSSRRIFSRAVAMEKKSTETAFKARSDERFIVRRASIESFFSSAMSYSSSKGKFDFRGFLWFCNTLLGGLGFFCSTVRRGRDALSFL